MEPDKIYFLDSHIAGRLYGQADAAWPLLRVGQRLHLVREPINPRDPDAVAVFFHNGEDRYKLGYLPFSDNRLIALMLDMGWDEAFEATISRLDASAQYDRQIGLIVKILRHKSNDRQTPPE